MLPNLWKKISAGKLRKAADKLDPPLPPSPVILSGAERHALDAIAELRGVTGVERTFNRKAQIFSNPLGSIVIENELGAGLRAKRLISGAGQITLVGFKVLEQEDYSPLPAVLRKGGEKSAYREEVVT